MVKTLERKCFCGSNTGEILHTQHFALYDGHLLPKSYDVVSCLNCGFIFADTPASQSVYDEYYKSFSKYEYPDTNEQILLKRQAAERIRFLVNGNTETKILDVGCASGGKLLNLKKFGFSNLYGLDPSPVCTENLRQNGINAIPGSIFTFDTNEKFDVVTLDAVLEHIVDLNLLIQRLARLLKTGGFLTVSVPDACGYDRIEANKPFSAFNTEHINHFDFSSLSNLGGRHGLCVYEFEDDIDGSIETNIFCVYQKPNIENLSAKDAVKRHIEQSQEYVSSLKFSNDDTVLIWGAGNHLSRLVAAGIFDRVNILGFVDRDIHKVGKTYMGKQIYSPEFIASLDEAVTIVVCAENYAEEIRGQILSMAVKNNIVLL